MMTVLYLCFASSNGASTAGAAEGKGITVEMKFDPDKEMEQLLRAHAGSGAAKSASAAAARGPLPDEEHLDADELSAFAENALPPAARARYTIHLADCDRCRGIVAGLSSAANIAGALEQSSQTVSVPTTNLNDKQRGWLASLFSLSGLRFALPVLAFLVIGGIVWRAYEVPRADRSKAEFKSAAAIKSEQQDVAQSNTTTVGQTASAPVSPPEVADNKKGGNEQSKKATENASGPASNSGSGNVAQSSSLSPVPAAPPPALAERQNQAATPQQDGEAGKQKETRDERSAAGVAEENVEVANSAAQPSAEKARSDEPRGAAATSAAAPRRQASSKPAEADDKLASSDSAMRQREAPKPSAAGAGGAQKDEAKNRVMKAQRAAIADEAEAVKSSETRNVGGRQFQRRGGVWTDTAYVSGSATVNIKRGSEQYRALVADEPTLRAISERLSGDVIVVWKGRAYSFR